MPRSERRTATTWPAWLARIGLLGSCCALLGCTTTRGATADSLLKQPASSTAVREYRVGSPDVLQVDVKGHPEWSGSRWVEVNGCIDMGPLGGVRVEGLTAEEVERRLAEFVGVPRQDVEVKLAQFASQRVYLFGEVAGEQRAVPYQGPETVVDLLRRVGGITEDGAPHEVRVIRQADLDAANSQVFQVDLQAILLKGDQSTNIKVQPYDQIYVPESRACRVGKCLHPWLRPVARVITGNS